MGELAEDLENGGFSWMEEVAGEGKIRAEGDQAAGDLDGAVERVEEEGGWRRSCGEGVEKCVPCLEAVDGEWALGFAGEAELCDEYGELDGERGGGNPLVQAALAEGGVRVFFQEFGKAVKPSIGDRVCVPRMDAEGGKHEIRMGEGERFDRGPIRLAGGVGDATGDSGRAHGGDDWRWISEARVLEVVVGVGPAGHGSAISAGRAGRLFSGYQT